jgi:exopolyphosphatase/guanosine-5'-triphosphate,3'-diphosphate pyrophosphatase
MASETFAWQVLCLRLAAIKCHARADIDNSALGLRPRGRDAQLSWQARWPEAHPRTLYLLREEVTAWTRSGPLRLVLPDA